MWPYLAVEVEGSIPKPGQKIGLDDYTFWGCFSLGVISKKSNRLRTPKLKRKREMKVQSTFWYMFPRTEELLDVGNLTLKVGVFVQCSMGARFSDLHPIIGMDSTGGHFGG